MPKNSVTLLAGGLVEYLDPVIIAEDNPRIGDRRLTCLQSPDKCGCAREVTRNVVPRCSRMCLRRTGLGATRIYLVWLRMVAWGALEVL